MTEGPICRAHWLGRIDYRRAWRLQQRLAEARLRRRVPDTLLLLEHPPTYTVGRRGGEGQFLLTLAEMEAKGASVHWVDRGGSVTFHGPGQLVGYPIMDLSRWRPDVDAYLRALEEVLIRAIRELGVRAERSPGYTGVWIGDDKVAAIGVKLSRWVTTHGFALNLSCDLRWFDHIVPCGLAQRGVTSLERAAGVSISMEDMSRRVCRHFGAVFQRQMVWVGPGEGTEGVPAFASLSASAVGSERGPAASA